MGCEKRGILTGFRFKFSRSGFSRTASKAKRVLTGSEFRQALPEEAAGQFSKIEYMAG
jgi:hypothetical protein